MILPSSAAFVFFCGTITFTAAFFIVVLVSRGSELPARAPCRVHRPHAGFANRVKTRAHFPRQARWFRIAFSMVSLLGLLETRKVGGIRGSSEDYRQAQRAVSRRSS